MDTFRTELMEQPAALTATGTAMVDAAALYSDLVARVARDQLDRIVVTGMGGSYYAAIPLSLRLAAAGRPVTLLDTAELLHTASSLLASRALLVMVTQSGETIEAVRLLERAGGRVPLVAVTNGRDNTVARAADYVLATAAGAERSVSGKSYVTSLLVLETLARALLGEPAPPSLWQPAIATARALLADWDAIEATLAGVVGAATPLYVLGRGASLATAGTGALTIKEAARRPAEGLSAAQFRHGPLEMIGPGMGALLLAPAGPTRSLILRLAAEMAGYGAATVVIGPPEPATAAAGVTWVSTPPLDPWLAPIAEIVPLQILSHRLARDAGHEPGRFDRMGKVTRVE
ncbi:MAG: SIS domain-containing protein [Chloroflexi bacterium]|nr:SIS domain-containing protein [Chloroflexota bacterium]